MAPSWTGEPQVLSVVRADAQVREEKRADVGSLFERLGQPAGAVAGVGLDTDQDRPVVARPGLQCGGVFEGVRGHHAIVVVGGRHQDRRIFPALPDVVQRRVAQQVTELRLVVAGAVEQRRIPGSRFSPFLYVTNIGMRVPSLLL